MARRRLVAIAAAGLLVAAAPACTGAPDDEAPAGASSASSGVDSAAVDAIFADYDVPGSPGASVMVIRDGEILHSAGYGAANLETDVPLAPSTPVRLGSVSKAFTGMAIVILEEQGALGFDDLAIEYVPELERFPGITVRHLLTHTSGLPDYYGDGSPLGTLATAPDGEAPFQVADAAAIYRTWGEPEFAPGDRFQYSNPGYEMLALIVERVSGMSFAQFLETEVFTPLEMRTAAVRDLPTTIIPDRAIGYAPDDNGGGWSEADDHWGNWMVGAGGVYASLDDLYQWDQALWRWAETGERTDEAFAPATLNDGTVSEYGFGWNVADLLEHDAVHHRGGWVGFRTALLRFTEERLTVIVLSNASADAEALSEATAALFLPEPREGR